MATNDTEQVTTQTATGAPNTNAAAGSQPVGTPATPPAGGFATEADLTKWWSSQVYGNKESDQGWLDYNGQPLGTGNADEAHARLIANWKNQSTAAQNATNTKTDQQYQGGDINRNNVADFASGVINDPSAIISGNNSLQNQTANQQIDTNAGLMDNADPLGANPNVSSSQVDPVTGKPVQGYDVATTEQSVAQNQMTGATGQLSDGAIISPDEVAQNNTNALANGQGPVGEAINKFASVNLSNVIDTSTAAGKQLAEQLGVNGYVDSKATLKGQLDLLQSEFQDADGNPKIPVWAQGAARNVGKIAAFSGMTGTAATAAMSNAIMEASISVAQQDAQFFQTLTVQNLSNEQQQVINTANILAQMEQQNTSNRQQAAIENSKNFMQMDMANLSNEQQAEVINNQARIQSILSDANAKNTERMFVAQTQADTDKFYDQLNTQIKQQNAALTLDADKYNATMADSREKYYRDMQYNIDVSNAKWRQTVQLTEDQQAYEAAATDVKNMVDLSTNQLNQIWDQADAILDYAWKTSENDKNRAAQIAVANIQAEATKESNRKGGNSGAWGQIAGSIIGSIF